MRLAGPTVVVTLLALISQAAGYLVQVGVAALFGASAEVDALVAATSLPQYVLGASVSYLGFTLIPLLAAYDSPEERAPLLAGLWGATLLVLSVVAVLGVALSEPLIGLAAPGLPNETRAQATVLSTLIWPSLVASGLIAVMSAALQQRGAFTWPAVVPLLGSLLHLGLLWLLAPVVGITAAAIALLAAAWVQALLIARGHIRGLVRLAWRGLRHPGLGEAARLLLPLLVAGVFVRLTPVVDRALASGLATGTLAALDYAFRLASGLALLSIGVATVIFPRLAEYAAANDLAAVRRTLGTGLLAAWLVAAPASALCLALADPLVEMLLVRGSFGAEDAARVAELLRVYALGLAGMCLGNVTGRGFYALRDLRVLSAIGILESLLYPLYALALVWLLGATGIALAFVVLYSGSVAWHLLLLRRRLGGGGASLTPFLRTALVAIAGGALAWAVAALPLAAPLRLALGGLAGLAAFGLGLRRLNREEWGLIASLWPWTRTPDSLVTLDGRT